MGLLNGDIANLFGGIFGAIYPDAMMHPRIRTDGSGGSATASYAGLGGVAGGIPCKVQRDKATFAMREQEGYAVGDVAFIILTQRDGFGLPEPVKGWRLTWPWPNGTLYSIEGPSDLDAAGSHWLVRGRPVPRSG